MTNLITYSDHGDSEGWVLHYVLLFFPGCVAILRLGIQVDSLVNVGFAE